MHSFEVHSNESACRKKVRLGLEQVFGGQYWKIPSLYNADISFVIASYQRVLLFILSIINASLVLLGTLIPNLSQTFFVLLCLLRDSLVLSALGILDFASDALFLALLVATILYPQSDSFILCRCLTDLVCPFSIFVEQALQIPFHLDASTMQLFTYLASSMGTSFFNMLNGNSIILYFPRVSLTHLTFKNRTPLFKQWSGPRFC